MEISDKLSIVPIDQIPKAHPCPTDDLIKLYKTCLLLEELCTRENGIGVSAVQAGIPWDLFVVKFEDSYRYFCNCKYEPLADDKSKSIEGCLSIKNPDGSLRHFEVERYLRIKLMGQELVVEPELDLINIEIYPEDYYRIVYQHEIDHARQILISDIGREFLVWS